LEYIQLAVGYFSGLHDITDSGIGEENVLYFVEGGPEGEEGDEVDD
jgi:hypothetical protein